MADTYETSRARRVLSMRFEVRWIFDTPLRDLLRGRVTRSLDWRASLAAAKLPAPIADSIRRVVKRTRLWRSEKAGVTEELIAHFGDGLAAGATPESLLKDFGDERTLVKLLNRAKRRQRPLAWHALNWFGRGVLVLLAFYGILIARFVLAAPAIKVDYVAQLNEPILRVAEADRAWPVYRRAILSLGIAPNQKDQPLERLIDQPNADGTGDTGRKLVDATPADAAWSELQAWLASHAEGIALLREAAAKPQMGFILGPAGSEHDPELGWNFSHNGEANVQPMMSVLLPSLNHMRQLARVLQADARDAREQNDAARVEADLVAMLGIARHQDAPILVTRLVGMGIDQLTFSEIELTLAARPDLLSDRQLIGLAHRVANIGGETAASLVDLSSERMFFRDVVQRAYSDDGHGDGILTMKGAEVTAPMVADPFWKADNKFARAGVATLGGAAALITSRRATLAEYDRLMDLQERLFARPMWQSVHSADDIEGEITRRIDQIQKSPLESARLFPIGLLFPALTRAAWTAERVLAERDGITTGIALELYRRHHGGAFPERLDVLVPDYLPKAPLDRITGDPLRLRVNNGRAIVYSVGVDRDDDLGRPPEHEPLRAAELRMPTDNSARRHSVDGDWIVFDSTTHETR